MGWPWMYIEYQILTDFPFAFLSILFFRCLVFFFFFLVCLCVRLVDLFRYSYCVLCGIICHVQSKWHQCSTIEKHSSREKRKQNDDASSIKKKRKKYQQLANELNGRMNQIEINLCKEKKNGKQNQRQKRNGSGHLICVIFLVTFFFISLCVRIRAWKTILMIDNWMKKNRNVFFSLAIVLGKCCVNGRAYAKPIGCHDKLYPIVTVVFGFFCFRWQFNATI